MSQLEKLYQKLIEGRITGSELISLLGKLDWKLKRQVGSHQTWSDGEKILVLIANRKHLKNYQITDAQCALEEGYEKKKKSL